MKTLLQGDLAFASPKDVLEWLESQGKACSLAFSSDNLKSNFYLKDGRIIYATSGSAGKRLGEFLVERDVLKQSDLATALAESAQNGRTLTTQLIESGHVTRHTLTNLFNRLVEQILTETIACRSGSFIATAPLPAKVQEGPVFFDSTRKLADIITHTQSKARTEAIVKLNDRLMNEEVSLPVLPKVASQLRKIMEDENSSLQSMTRIIMSDQVIASAILKVANSPFYSVKGQTDSVNLAVSKIGTRTALAIVTAVELKGIQLPDVPREKMQAIMDDALKSAFIASGLAMQCYQDPEQAFLGGLLRDLGKTVILSVAAGCKVDSDLLEEFINERHAEIGALIAGRWNYPESLQNLIRCHHDRLAADGDREIAVLQIVDGLVQHGADWKPDPELLQLLGLDEAGVREISQVALQSAGEFGCA